MLLNYIPHLIVIVLALNALIFLLVVYSTKFSLKTQLEKIGLKNPEFLTRLQNAFPSSIIESSSLLERIQLYIYGVLDVFGVRPLGPIYSSFRGAIRALKSNLTAEDLYSLPWFIVIGDNSSGKKTVLQNIGLSTPISSPSFAIPTEDPLLQWWFYENGIVLEISEKCLTTEKVEESWDTILKALKRYRSYRPIDGIVLTTPATYFTEEEILSKTDIVQSASLLSRQLSKAGYSLGFKLPLYFIMTKCDQVAGFSGFCKELPNEALSEIVGWSNPYATDLAYQDSWAVEGFDKIYTSLFQSILRIFSKKDVGEFSDDLMIFPQAFSNLKENVGIYLGSIFNRESYADYLTFRGIFLTGDPGESLERHPFLKDLFKEKIFAEIGSAIPIKRFLTSASRTINLVRLGIVIVIITGTYGLYWAQGKLSRAVHEVRPSFVEAVNNLQQEYPSIFTEDDINRGNTRAILDLFIKIYESPLTSPVLLPSSLTLLSKRLEGLLVLLFEQRIEEPIHSLLERKAHDLIKEPLPIMNSEKSFSDPTQTTEFLLLEGYVNALMELQKVASIYETLPETKDLKGLAELISYIYNYNLSPNFMRAHENLGHFLINAGNYPPFYLQNYQVFAQKRLYELYNNFLRKILDPNYNYSLAQKLQKTLNKVQGEGFHDLENLRDSLREIKNLMTFITTSGASWLTSPKFDPGSKYEVLMSKIRQIVLFSASVEEKLAKTSGELYIKATAYLKSYGSPLTGHFLTASPLTKQLEPSAGLINLEKRLSIFLAKPFMQKVEGPSFLNKIPKGQFVHWNPQAVRNSLALAEDYKEFVSQDLSSYPANLQNPLRIGGKAQLQKNINAILEKGQTLYDEPVQKWTQQSLDASQSQIDNIAEVGPIFLKLLRALDQVQAHETHSRLKSALFDQMYEQLKGLDETLTQADYYTPADPSFLRWEGEKDGVLKSFDMTDKNEMKSYFENQSAQIVTLATQYSVPIIEFLKSDIFNLSIDQIKLVSKWYTLIQQSINYKKSKPSGSLNILENFLTDTGNDITYETCFVKTTLSPSAASTSDYFLGRRNVLLKSMNHRCEVMAAEKAAIQYEKIATFFNDNLANLFPFTAQTPRTAQLDSEVSVDAMNALFEELDALTPSLQNAIGISGHYKKTWADAKKFLDTMNEVKDFFRTYFSPKVKGGEAGTDFSLKFQENKVNESYGEFFSDWAFIFGSKSLSLQTTGNGSGRWETGGPVSFGFEWIPGSALYPAENSLNPSMVLVGPRVLFIYEGTWALLRAMMLHQTSVKKGGYPNNQVMLSFNIPLGPVAKAPPTAKARLFVKLVPKTNKGLSAVNFKIPQFPTAAPKLTPDS
jgi:type VI secretion system protein ImpL